MLLARRGSSPLARILFTASFGRSARNWVAAFEMLRARGHDVAALIFPVLPDPDHRGLDALGFPLVARVPVSERPRNMSGADLRGIAATVSSAVEIFAPDLVVATACHVGPELDLLELLAGTNLDVVTAGCQHGFVQLWNAYWNRFAFDHLLVFGDAFRRLAPPELVARVRVAGLPKLDAVPRIVRPSLATDRRPVVFAAQTEFPETLASTLARLGPQTGREVVIRPHPAYPLPSGALGTGLRVIDPSIPLADHLADASLLITTGSTVVLEALVAGCPVVALPLQGGDQYTSADIVASTISTVAILEVAARYEDPGFQAGLLRFLADTTGSAERVRTPLAADTIESLLPSSRTGEPQT